MNEEGISYYPSHPGFNANEEEICKSQGIQYENIPVMEATDMTKEYVDSVVAKMEQLPSPSLIHCKVGLCACISVLLREGKSMKAAPEDVMDWANDLGFNLTSPPQVYQLVKDYLKE